MNGFRNLIAYPDVAGYSGLAMTREYGVNLLGINF